MQKLNKYLCILVYKRNFLLGETKWNKLFNCTVIIKMYVEINLKLLFFENFADINH